MSHITLQIRADNWRRGEEGSSFRWQSQSVRKLIYDLLTTLKASELAYERIVQCCDSANKMLHEAQSDMNFVLSPCSVTHSEHLRECRDRISARLKKWDKT